MFFPKSIAKIPDINPVFFSPPISTKIQLLLVILEWVMIRQSQKR